MIPITIVMTTYFRDQQRKEVAEKTLESWVKNLKYEGKLRLCVSDDGSNIHWNPELIWTGPIEFTRQERHGVGASLNAGFKEAYRYSPLVAYFVDDWSLEEPFDITPWAQGYS